MLERVELGEKPSQGGTKMSFAHCTGTELLFNFSHQAVPIDHHLMVNPCSENATKP